MSQLTFLEQLNRERRALSVSELTARIKATVETKFFEVWVEGEISNFKRHASGHWYFSLKDQNASLRCASYRLQNRLIRFKPEDGQHVRARGRITVYEPRGEYQFAVEQLEPAGLGALQLAFEQLKSRLDAEGLFRPERKRPLPMLPRCVGVVTSPSGAALRDILRVLARRNQAVSVLIAPARVQGEGATGEIVRAIRLLNSRSEVDVIIVGRGGGSLEDLWCFNEEVVARTIARSRVPIISAVGHETDYTIADFVADLRASTPSAAAEIVATGHSELCERLRQRSVDVQRLINYKLKESRANLEDLASSRGFEALQARIQKTLQRIDDSMGRLERLMTRRLRAESQRIERLGVQLREADVARALASQRSRLSTLDSQLRTMTRAVLGRLGERVSVGAGKLDSLSPLAVLARGYAIAFDGQGQVIKRADDVAAGGRVRVKVSDGDLNCIKE